MRALSGIQATGNITIGNYLGAIKMWADSQDKYDENFYFIPDLHTLTVRQDPKELRAAILSTVAWLMAAGIDHKRSTIYAQSHIPAHTELSWIFNNYVTMGELSRMTQYKDKVAKRSAEGQVVGLFTYPALMAADILLYDADAVPVGEDQVQHVELTRNIAERFNHLYGDTFRLPKPVTNKQTARIMDLQDPTKKMSKSEPLSSAGVLRMLDTPEDILKKLSRAVTDSGNDIKVDPQKPGITNLLNILSAFSDQSITELEKAHTNQPYGQFKQEVGDAVIKRLSELQKKFKEILEDEDQIIKVLEEGRNKVQPIAKKKLLEVKTKLGLINI